MTILLILNINCFPYNIFAIQTGNTSVIVFTNSNINQMWVYLHYQTSSIVFYKNNNLQIIIMSNANGKLHFSVWHCLPKQQCNDGHVLPLYNNTKYTLFTNIKRNVCYQFRFYKDCLG